MPAGARDEAGYTSILNYSRGTAEQPHPHMLVLFDSKLLLAVSLWGYPVCPERESGNDLEIRGVGSVVQRYV